MSTQFRHDHPHEPRRSSAFGFVEWTDEPVVAAIVRSRADGFIGEFVLEADSIPPGVLCRSCGHLLLVERVHVLGARRFGRAAAGDAESIVVAMRCGRCETDGLLIIVRADGMTTADAELLLDIVRRVPGDADGRRARQRPGRR